MDLDWYKREHHCIGILKNGIIWAQKALKEEETELATARKQHEYAVQTQQIITTLAREVQQKVHQRISSVVSTCLEAVFDDPYEFKIEFEQKRGATVANLKFVRNGRELSPMEASGGGAVDVAAFALRAACLVLHRPVLQRVLLLDEPFKFVSKEYQPAIRSMLEQLARDLKIQIIMVTHNEAYETGKVIEL